MGRPIFISYAREARIQIRDFAGDCRSLGFDVWFDEHITGGSDWWENILAAIRRADIFIYALSRESLDSEACRRESAYASELRRTTLPVLVGDGIVFELLPPSLASAQIIDYRHSDREALMQLSRALISLPPSPSLPNPLPPSPPSPISELGALSEAIRSPSLLSFENQTALVLRLKYALLNPKAREHVILLAKILMQRDDLYAKVAGEVERFLASNESEGQAIQGLSPSATAPLTELVPRNRFENQLSPSDDNSSNPTEKILTDTEESDREKSPISSTKSIYKDGKVKIGQQALTGQNQSEQEISTEDAPAGAPWSNFAFFVIWGIAGLGLAIVGIISAVTSGNIYGMGAAVAIAIGWFLVFRWWMQK